MPLSPQSLLGLFPRDLGPSVPGLRHDPRGLPNRGERHHKLCPSLETRKDASHQSWVLWPSPETLLLEKLPSRSMKNATRESSSCSSQSWPKATFLSSPGVTLATTPCKPKLQSVCPFFGGHSKTNSSDLVWKGRKVRATWPDKNRHTEAAS